MILQHSVLLGFCVLILTQICPSASFPGASSCLDQHQCPSGYFCSSSHYCSRCTDCSAYNRVAATECAQGIVECGDCFPGYVMGSVNPIGTCVEPSKDVPGTDTNNGTPIYIWVTLTFIVLALVIVIAFFVKLIKNKSSSLNGTAEIRVLSPTPKTLIENTLRPNNPLPTSHFGPAPNRGNMYVPIRPSSPEINPSYEGYHQNLFKHNEYIEESNMGHITSQKETELNQEAVVLKPPCYEDLVNSDEEASEELLPQEEETLESNWTQEQNVDNNETAGPNLSNLVEEARNTNLIRPPAYDSDPDGPPRKIPRRQPDNGRDSSDGPSSPAQRVPSIDQPPSPPTLLAGSTQGSNGIMLRGETRVRHDAEDCNNIRPTEINNNNQSSSSNTRDTYNNNSNSGVGSSTPSPQQPVQMSNLIMNISFQQNNDIKVMTT